MDDPAEETAGSDHAETPEATDGGAAEPRAPRNQGRVTSWTKALILSAAIVFIGVFAWYGVERFVGRRNWVVNYSVIAGLIGMGTASAMISAGRTGWAAKIVSVLSAFVAIVLGKALVLCAGGLPPELTQHADPARWAEAFARLAFKPIDGLFAAIVTIGIAVRFILSEENE